MAGRVVTLLGAALGGVLFVYLLMRFEGTEPMLDVPAGPISLGGEREISIRVGDDGTGLETVRIWVERDGRQFLLLEEHYPGSLLLGGTVESEQEISFVLDAREYGLDDGPAVVRVEARD